jgi:hypothetical protein
LLHLPCRDLDVLFLYFNFRRVTEEGYLPNLGEVVVVGGSANLAVPICQASGDRFWIAPEPQLFNIIAMAHISGGFSVG